MLIRRLPVLRSTLFMDSQLLHAGSQRLHGSCRRQIRSAASSPTCSSAHQQARLPLQRVRSDTTFAAPPSAAEFACISASKTGSGKSKWRVALPAAAEFASSSATRKACTPKARLAGLPSTDLEMSQPSQQDSRFKELGVDSRLVDRLGAEQGITVPTPVQIAAIPRVLQGQDVAVQCYTGSGKTLAYLLPIMTMAIARAEAEAAASRKSSGQWGTLQAVVVVPSRELGMQIVRVAQSLLPPESRQAVQQCIGGANPRYQAEALRENKPVLVVGTPGRLAELSRGGQLQTHQTSCLVLDEVDQLLDAAFREDLTRILEHTGKRCKDGRQTVLVSATLTPRVISACRTWCPNLQPLFVQDEGVVEQDMEVSTLSGADAPAAPSSAASPAGPQWGWDSNQPAARAPSGGTPADGQARVALPPHLEHAYVVTTHRHRVDTLRKCIHATNSQRALVFMNFQQRLKDTQHKLEANGMSVACLHGELSKMERQKMMAKFRNGDVRALIVSDVAARGLDVPDCDAVFNLELPSDAAGYAHRAGRTGRGGRPGTVVSLVTEGEAFVVNKLASRLQVPIPEASVAGGVISLKESR